MADEREMEAMAMAMAEAEAMAMAETASAASAASTASAAAPAAVPFPASPRVSTAAAAAATTTVSSAHEAAAATRRALLARPSLDDQERLLKQQRMDPRGACVTGFVWARTCKPGDNSALWLTTVVVPRPANCAETFLELDTFEHVPRNEKKTHWFWKPPVTENAKFRFFYDTTMLVKEGFGSPINTNLRPGHVVEIVGLRYERSWDRNTDRYVFSITAGEIRASKTKLAELVDASRSVAELTQLNGTLAAEAVRAYDEDYVRVMGVRDDYNMDKVAKTPDDPYAICRRVFVLPIDQAFVDTESDHFSRRQNVVATFFDPRLNGERSYLAKITVPGPEKSVVQRVLRTVVGEGADEKTGAVPFLVKQLRFTSAADPEATMITMHMPVYAEKLLVVPKQSEWTSVGPVLAAGMVGAFAVTPKATLVAENQTMPNMTVHGTLVWDLARTVQNVGIEVPADVALAMLGATPEQDITGKVLDEAPRKFKDSKDVPLPLLHAAPLTDCVNLGFYTGNITRLVEAATSEPAKATFVAVASFLRFDSLAQLKPIQALPWPERRARYEELVKFPEAHKQTKVAYQVFAVAPNVVSLLDAKLASAVL